MTDKAYAVPLHELLARVPRDARLVIDDPDGMGTQYIPVGRHCHEAAEELRARLAQPEPKYQPMHPELRKMYEDYFDAAFEKLVPPQREWQGLTDEEILADDVLRYHFALNGGAGPISKKGMAVIAAVNAKLKEKNA